MLSRLLHREASSMMIPRSRSCAGVALRHLSFILAVPGGAHDSRRGGTVRVQLGGRIPKSLATFSAIPANRESMTCDPLFAGRFRIATPGNPGLPYKRSRNARNLVHSGSSPNSVVAHAVRRSSSLGHSPTDDSLEDTTRSIPHASTSRRSMSNVGSTSPLSILAMVDVATLALFASARIEHPRRRRAALRMPPASI